jgi:hypothetical protein
MTAYTREYLAFRDTLNNRQLENLKNRLLNMLTLRELPSDVLTIIELGSGLKFHVYVDRSRGIIWLLGGYWVRAGEPSPYFLDKMNDYAARLVRGEDISGGN